MKGGMMFSKGDIVVVQFPFSDLINSKKRPMLVLAERGNDIIGCAITSNPESDGVLLEKFEQGSLPLTSKVKYWQIHTIMRSLILKKIAKVSKENHLQIIEKVEALIEL